MIVSNPTDKSFKGAIDAHQHFWHYEPIKHSWINDEMASIRKDFLPADLAPVLKENGIEGCIAVQADQTEDETAFLLQLAKENDFIKGVVGWTDLSAKNAQDRLEHYGYFPAVKGFRHILQGEEPEFMLQPDFKSAIGLFKYYDFTYDILIYPKHLSAALELVKYVRDQPFVIDHIAKPYIKDGLLDEWKKGMQAMAQYPYVYCKISGMVTEADMRNWKETDFRPYLDVVTEAFGVNRLIYGSDWPVCLAAGSYKAVLDIAKNYFAGFSAAEQQAIFGGNAARFYHLT